MLFYNKSVILGLRLVLSVLIGSLCMGCNFLFYYIELYVGLYCTSVAVAQKHSKVFLEGYMAGCINCLD